MRRCYALWALAWWGLYGCGGGAGNPVRPHPGAIVGPTPRVEAPSRYGNPKSYVVWGTRYHVRASAEGYQERGIASWYGSKFHGRRTSSGEIYDMHKMSAAHRTLPLPTYVLVTHLGNQRQVIVRVNDRGPFHDDRVIDLSYAAAGHLGLRGTGTALVEVRALRPGERPSSPEGATVAAGKATAAAGKGWTQRFLQVGSFARPENARALVRRIEAIGEPVRMERIRLKGSLFHRVWVGPYATARDSEDAQKRLRGITVEVINVVEHHRSSRSAPCRDHGIRSAGGRFGARTCHAF